MRGKLFIRLKSNKNFVQLNKRKTIKNIKIKQELKDKTIEIKEEIKGLFKENCVFYHKEKTKTSMKNKWVKIMNKFFYFKFS